MQCQVNQEIRNDNHSPSSNNLWVALYVCLSFCNCFSIFLFVSFRIFSSSSPDVLPLKHPILWTKWTKISPKYDPDHTIKQIRPTPGYSNMLLENVIILTSRASKRLIHSGARKIHNLSWKQHKIHQVPTFHFRSSTWQHWVGLRRHHGNTE